MATSRLQEETARLLFGALGAHFSVKENHRPEWLMTADGERLELDFYIEDLRLAIEVQGQQHFQAIPFFHRTPDAFAVQVRRDEHKKAICASKGNYIDDSMCS